MVTAKGGGALTSARRAGCDVIGASAEGGRGEGEGEEGGGLEPGERRRPPGRALSAAGPGGGAAPGRRPISAAGPRGLANRRRRRGVGAPRPAPRPPPPPPLAREPLAARARGDVLQAHRARPRQRQPRPGARGAARRHQRPLAVRLRARRRRPVPAALQRLRAALHGLRAGYEAPRCPGLAEHLHRPAVRHRGDGQGDPAHLRRQQERHGAAQAGHHPRAGAGAGVPGRDRAQRPHVTAAPGVPPPCPRPRYRSPAGGPYTHRAAPGAPPDPPLSPPRFPSQPRVFINKGRARDTVPGGGGGRDLL